jgi:hypothetical protein
LLRRCLDLGYARCRGEQQLDGALPRNTVLIFRREAINHEGAGVA